MKVKIFKSKGGENTTIKQTDIRDLLKMASSIRCTLHFSFFSNVHILYEHKKLLKYNKQFLNTL